MIATRPIASAPITASRYLVAYLQPNVGELCARIAMYSSMIGKTATSTHLNMSMGFGPLISAAFKVLPITTSNTTALPSLNCKIKAGGCD